VPAPRGGACGASPSPGGGGGVSDAQRPDGGVVVPASSAGPAPGRAVPLPVPVRRGLPTAAAALRQPAPAAPPPPHALRLRAAVPHNPGRAVPAHGAGGHMGAATFELERGPNGSMSCADPPDPPSGASGSGEGVRRRAGLGLCSGERGGGRGPLVGCVLWGGGGL
jgi:hypothetical protein